MNIIRQSNASILGQRFRAGLIAIPLLMAALNGCGGGGGGGSTPPSGSPPTLAATSVTLAGVADLSAGTPTLLVAGAPVAIGSGGAWTTQVGLPAGSSSTEVAIELRDGATVKARRMVVVTRH